MDQKTPGEFLATDFDSLVELAAAGHREIAPVHLRDRETGLSAVCGSHGLYRMGMHADGRPVVLFSADPDALRPAVHADARFRDKYAPGYYIDPAHMDRIDVVEARRKRTFRLWFGHAVAQHNHYLNDTKGEYGLLRRLTDTMWFSRAVAYTLDPAFRRDGLRRRAADGAPLYILRCYTTAGKGWPFTARDEEAIRSRRMIRFTRRKAYVRLENAEDAVRDDFIRRAALVMRDHDPDRLGQLKGEPLPLESPLAPPKGILPKAAYMGGYYVVRCVQAVAAELQTIKARVLVAGVTKTACLSLVKLFLEGWRAGLSQVLVGVFKPVMDAVKRVHAISGGAEDVGFTFWAPRRSLMTGRRHYCRLDPAQGLLIRYLGQSEAGFAPAQSSAALPADWAETYLLGTLHSPVGSVMERRRMNGADVLHVFEPSGLELFYVIHGGAVYVRHKGAAVHPQAERLPGPVERLLSVAGPSLRVRDRGDGGPLVAERVDPAVFDAMLMQEAAAAAARADCAAAADAPDLSLLRVFNARAQRREEAPLAQRMIRHVFALAARPLRMAGVLAEAVPPPPSLSERTLRRHLADRVSVDRQAESGAAATFPTGSERPASYTDRGVCP